MPDQNDPQYKLRFSVELRDKLKQAAQANHRSMNAEIVARLQRSFETGGLSGGTDAEEMARLMREHITHAEEILNSLRDKKSREQVAEKQ